MLSKLFRREPDDPQLAAHRRRFAEAAEPILADLRAAGMKRMRTSDDLQDLAGGRREPSPEAIEVLRAWLPRVEYLAVQGVVARTLMHTQSRPETAAMALDEYRKMPPEGTEARLTKDSLAQLVEHTAPRAMADAIAEVVLDPRHGASRSWLFKRLVKWRHPRATEVALAMLDDPDESLVGEAIWALGALKAQSARARLQEIAGKGWEEPVHYALEKLDRAREGRDPDELAALDAVGDETAGESKLPSELMPALREALPDLEDAARIELARKAVLELLGRGELELRYGRPLEDEFEVVPKRRWRSVLADDDEWLEDWSLSGGEYFSIAVPGSV